MLWIEEMMGTKKPIISMLHLKALPGDPDYKHTDCMDAVVKAARKDLHALQDGGVDAIMFSNEFSLPYQRVMDYVTPAAMARVIGELKSEIKVPFGVDCISDGKACIELAAAVDAAFIRGTFHGVYVGDGGFYNNDFSDLMRRKAALHLDNLKMLYFLNPESDISLDTRSLDEKAKSLIFKANPDGLCISASAAGEDVEDSLISTVKAVAPNIVVLCNTGCRVNTVADKLSNADAAVVGTTFKVDGDLYNPVSEERVSEFMEAVKAYRNTL
ncbi:MAG: BtpA/SgcQ family protein [Suipraeoptans sp.]